VLDQPARSRVRWSWPRPPCRPPRPSPPPHTQPSRLKEAAVAVGRGSPNRAPALGV